MTLKEYRTARGLTQEALAEILGVTKQMVSRWETGTSNPGSNALVNLATTLNVVITIKPDTRDISLVPAEDFKDPYNGLSQEQMVCDHKGGRRNDPLGKGFYCEKCASFIEE